VPGILTSGSSATGTGVHADWARARPRITKNSETATSTVVRLGFMADLLEKESKTKLRRTRFRAIGSKVF
jgi:hypothetical protein